MFQNLHQIQTSDVVKNTFKIPKISQEKNSKNDAVKNSTFKIPKNSNKENINNMFQKPHQVPGSDAYKNYQHAFLKFCGGSEPEASNRKSPNFKKKSPRAKRQKYNLTSFLKIPPRVTFSKISQPK